MTLAPLKKQLALAIYMGFWLGVIVFLTTATAAAAKPVESGLETTGPIGSPFAIADFDGDQRLDIATVQVGRIGASDTQYWIHFRLSSGVRQLIPLTAPLGGLRIASRDVNGDSFVDLVVTSVWREFPVAVLLNDGRGNFALRDPQSFPSIMASPQTSSASALTSASEVAAALLSRNLSTRCEAVREIASPAKRSVSLFAGVPHQKSAALEELVLGRAPPVLPLHV
jgi:hypothetical protein